MFILDDEELMYYRFHIFNPLPVTTPMTLIINTPNSESKDVDIFNEYILWESDRRKYTGLV